ncbi:hypothetical protein [Rhodanobacter sp. C01]|uniref:hypothetical protein n=1 Tax=Rhodanobacter sp. C01 TaxID=1945856 RepID=UPI000987CBFE|nr:hypothetical protein [Rhodanobacter sp. C01]OOG51586.1 hypothetical protein B0E50_00455 [Rhodanobacter sp. C01]
MDNNAISSIVEWIYIALCVYTFVGLLGRKLFASTKLGSLYKKFVNKTADGIMRGNVYTKYITWLVQAVILIVAISSADQVLILATVLYSVSKIFIYTDAKHLLATRAAATPSA